MEAVSVMFRALLQKEEDISVRLSLETPVGSLTEIDSSETFGSILAGLLVNGTSIRAFEIGGNMEDYLTCETANETSESLFRQLIKKDETGTLFLMVAGTGGGGGGSSFTIGRNITAATATFIDDDINTLVFGERATLQEFVIPEATLAAGDIITVMQLGDGLINISVENDTTMSVSVACNTDGVDTALTIICVDDSPGAEIYKIIGGYA